MENIEEKKNKIIAVGEMAVSQIEEYWEKKPLRPWRYLDGIVETKRRLDRAREAATLNRVYDLVQEACNRAVIAISPGIDDFEFTPDMRTLNSKLEREMKRIKEIL